MQFLSGTVVGLIVGFILLELSLGYSETWQIGEIAKKAKQDCESSLPRNEYCEIIAVPTTKEER